MIAEILGKKAQVACGVLIFNDHHEILLVKRKMNGHISEGRWGRPAGLIEFGETGAAAAIRETLEETGVIITIPHSTPNDFQEYIEPEHHCVMLGYIGEYVSGEARNREPGKHDDVRWFSLGSLPENLAHSTRKAIDTLSRKR